MKLHLSVDLCRYPAILHGNCLLFFIQHSCSFISISLKVVFDNFSLILIIEYLIEDLSKHVIYDAEFVSLRFDGFHLNLIDSIYSLYFQIFKYQIWLLGYC